MTNKLNGVNVENLNRPSSDQRFSGAEVQVDDY